jgi:hypothetical protein
MVKLMIFVDCLIFGSKVGHLATFGGLLTRVWWQWLRSVLTFFGKRKLTTSLSIIFCLKMPFKKAHFNPGLTLF